MTRAELDSRGEPEVVVVPTSAVVGRMAAERIAAALDAAIGARGSAHLVTTGGSASAGIHAALRSGSQRSAVDWPRVHLWVGDERVVPWTDPRSNMAAAVRELVAGGGLPIGGGRIHPWPVEAALARGHDAAWVAARLDEEAARLVPGWTDGRPAFDVVVVGVGPDGHLLSLFPGSRALDSDAGAALAAGLTLAVPAPTHVEPHVERVTFGPLVLDGARTLIAAAFGASKAPVLGAVFGEVHDERRWPAQRARRFGATWILDEAAAANLGGRQSAGGG